MLIVSLSSSDLKLVILLLLSSEEGRYQKSIMISAERTDELEVYAPLGLAELFSLLEIIRDLTSLNKDIF